MADIPPRPVRLVISNAPEVTPRAPDPDPPQDDGHRGGDRGGPVIQLPPGCPVTPLGAQDNKWFYLDAMRQLRALSDKEHSRLGIQGLFGSRSYLLEEFWPRKSKQGDDMIVTGWKPELASMTLMAAASARGVWNPMERVRGRGAWLGDNGELVLHCGDVLYDGRKWHEPGMIGRHVYPAASPILRPISGPVRGRDNPADELLALFNTWNLRRKELDALLVLGWFGAAWLGGALGWRPVMWITGGKGTGKSTFHTTLGRLFDTEPQTSSGALVQVAEASAAGIWQKLGHATLPVNIDEAEPEEGDNRKLNATVKLARLAASGGLILRGGADHSASEFTARSCFLFSSILIPPLLGQDRSRIAIIELGELPKGQPAPDISARRLRDMGARLLRRLVDGFPRLATTLEAYRGALLDAGHSSRGADVFGTLLACADLLRHDHEPDSDTLLEITDKLRVDKLAEIEDDARDEERCLQHLLSSAVPIAGGVKRSIAELIEHANSDDPEIDWRPAERTLETYGLAVKRTGEKGETRYFAVANYHVELARLFEGTHWSGRSGTMGVWVQALRRIEGAERSAGNIRFASMTGKAVILPLGAVTSCPDDTDKARRETPSPLPLR